MKSTSSIKRNTAKVASIALSLVFILAFALPPASVVQAQGESGPGIEAFAWFDRYTLFNWPEGIPVEVTIVGPDYTAEPFTPEASDGWYEFFPGVDLKPGTTITASNGEGEGRTTKVLVISPLSGRVLDAATGKVKGEATPGRTFHMKTMGDNFPASIEQDIQTDRKGKWSVTIASFLPWAWFTRGEMWEADEDGDVTYAIWHVNQPVIEVWLPENEIRAFDWPLNTELTYSVNGKVIGTALTQPVGWYDGTWAVLNAGELALKPGDIVMVSDEDVTKRTTVQDIKITYVNVDDNTVSGTGPVNADLELTSSAEAYVHFFNTGNNPEWMVSFTELNNGDYLRLFLRDRDKDSTVWDVNANNPHLNVYPEAEAVEALEFPEGAGIHLTIEDSTTGELHDFWASVPHPENPWTNLRFELGRNYDLKPGDVVTVTDGIITRTYKVRNLMVTEIDAEMDVVRGMTEAGVTVRAWPNGWPDVYIETYVDESGVWIADFSSFDPFDLVPGVCGRSQIDEEFGNATVVDWCLPIQPWLEAFPAGDAVDTWDWAPGTSVNLYINGETRQEWTATMGAASPEDSRMYARIEVGYDNLKVGDVVSVTNGTATITHTVQNLGIYSVSVDNNSVSGWANSNSQVTLWPHGFDQTATKIVNADENGFWRANFWPEFDIVGGSAGRSHVLDENGNATAVDWSTNSAYWREDFNQAEGLNSEWYWPNGDPGGWSLTDYSFLQLPLSHTGTPSGNMLLKGVQQGDFSFKTHIIFEPTADYQFAGLVIYQNQDNFLQLGRAYCDSSEICVGNGIYFDYLEGGDWFANPNYATPVTSSNEAYLRLEKRGDMVRGYYSADGVTWIIIGDHWLPWDFQVNGIGIAASNNLSDQENSADFDFVELTEADGFLPEGYHDYNDGEQPISGCTAGGWATDPDDRNVDLNIRIDVDENTLDLPLTANITRPDLMNVCIDGNCSFDTSLWGLIAPDIFHEITVFAQDAASGEWARLYNTPKYLTCHSEG